ncbi:hypothetical protein ACSFBI_05160 [Variovorax sp. RB3P1]|uniref:hypothetical protein n=1 Tax=Variovorax sp. RB3P1 TaxID=3443732 RepID=UPI003F48E297
MKLLVSRGADFHKDEELIMRGVASLGLTFTLEMMLEHGCDIHAMNDYAIKAVASQNDSGSTNLILIDFNMPIKTETKHWLEENNCTEALDIIATRDLNNDLEAALKPKDETTVKTRKQKI